MRTCTCIDGAAEHDLTCPVHGIARTTLIGAHDLHGLIGLRTAPLVAESIGPRNEQLDAIFAAAPPAPVGRIIDGGHVVMRPFNPTPVPEVTAPCGCDMPGIFGHDTDCMLHPAPIAPEPLQLLISAIELILDQPTTEQWQTIKKAIHALARLDTTARSD